jgi:hypothetical protein
MLKLLLWSAISIGATRLDTQLLNNLQKAVSPYPELPVLKGAILLHVSAINQRFSLFLYKGSYLEKLLRKLEQTKHPEFNRPILVSGEDLALAEIHSTGIASFYLGCAARAIFHRKFTFEEILLFCFRQNNRSIPIGKLEVFVHQIKSSIDRAAASDASPPPFIYLDKELSGAMGQYQTALDAIVFFYEISGAIKEIGSYGLPIETCDLLSHKIVRYFLLNPSELDGFIHGLIGIKRDNAKFFKKSQPQLSQGIIAYVSHYKEIYPHEINVIDTGIYKIPGFYYLLAFVNFVLLLSWNMDSQAFDPNLTRFHLLRLCIKPYDSSRIFLETFKALFKVLWKVFSLLFVEKTFGPVG